MSSKNAQEEVVRSAFISGISSNMARIWVLDLDTPRGMSASDNIRGGLSGEASCLTHRSVAEIYRM
ncbi:UDP-glucose glycoprotein glucosyltransferase [Aspergillus luchuensis]|uniref:UDP-glucose glycoprotein glucosyltransferase n=1 Tax=Aspergillus kawachii TaxID=1069201 RepID=A0A146G273_ASPKA|nr:UDP-glucose glycoprotein glucosyltransferase [Aspergillus luchuensis]